MHAGTHILYQFGVIGNLKIIFFDFICLFLRDYKNKTLIAKTTEAL